MQLKFLQYYENVDVPQFPFLDRVLLLPVVLRRRVRAVQTVQKFFVFCFFAHCCALTGAGDGPDSAENREVSARVLGHGCLARCDARQGVVQTVQKTVKFPLAFLDLVQCPSLCNDSCRMVETVQKTVESPQLLLALGQGC